ncbi:hypothetical protein DAPPUDRAFT_335484 [Daphnia pulex]|uniref:DUF2523 domain-containing protein n=1 Tax=Daphnia pulex TaxID=6669 RepID=E9HXV5_DAPPU|nr:hypothetical protein DAPPUDRAFT_335484 [Daphnia pulex]|eukprot:EFX63428.1 hypothetical protein DAPPUDRAFT_335484 [Daphnia pulex]
MPAVLAAVGVWIISSVIAKVLVALGIGLFTYYGLFGLVEELIDQLRFLLGDMPPAVFQIISLFGFPEGLSILCSAFLTRAAIQSTKVFFGLT